MSLLNQIIILLVAVNMSKLHIGKTGMQGHEMVMSQGMTISIKNKTGSIRIEALDNLTRKFYWDDNTEQTKMKYRNERWYGKYGAYRPGGRSDVHMVIEEGQQHFCSQQEAEEWLQFRDHIMKYIFTKDGLAVGWYKEYNRIKDGYPDVLSVDIIQVYICGKKPLDLFGAQDSLFSITYSKDYVDNIIIGQYQPSLPKIIGQRLYSGKVIDIMEERGIKPERIERCIAKGSILEGTEFFTNLVKRGYTNYAYYKRGDGILLVSTDKDGRVVFVGN